MLSNTSPLSLVIESQKRSNLTPYPLDGFSHYLYHLYHLYHLYQPHPLCPPLLTKERGRGFLKGFHPFKLPTFTVIASRRRGNLGGEVFLEIASALHASQ